MRSVTIRVTDEQMVMLDEMASKREIDRSALLRKLIERAHAGDKRSAITTIPASRRQTVSPDFVAEVERAGAPKQVVERLRADAEEKR